MPSSRTKLPSFKPLPAFRLEMLAGLVASHNELRHQRRFGLRSVECHVLGVVGAQAPISLRDLCRDLGLDRSHGSRLVAKLIDQGLVERYDDPADKRSFYLLLTEAGTRLHAQIHEDAVARNQEWMAGLAPARRSVFMDCITQLMTHSQAMLDRERAQAAGPRAAAPDAAPADGKGAQALVLVERARLQKLYEQLGQLLAPPAP